MRDGIVESRACGGSPASRRSSALDILEREWTLDERGAMHPLSGRRARDAGFELLGPPLHGGGSIVFEARRIECGRLVALKLNGPGQDPARIDREARTLRELDHPGIVRPVEHGRLDGLAYLATEWVDGETLRHLVSRRAERRLPPRSVLALGGAVADALDHAHARGVAHGDVSPGNILVTGDRHATLIDFGLGRAADAATVTAHGELAGTPRYLAPEVIRGEAPDRASDQYALALVVYELLTGRWPYSPRSPDVATALHHQLYGAPDPPSEVRPELPAASDRVFARALHKSPEARFGSAGAFLDALRRAFRDENPDRRDRRTRSGVARRGGGRPSGAGHRTVTGVGVVATVGLLALGSGWSVGPADDAPSVRAAHDRVDAATRSAETRCNLFPNAGFDRAIGENFFRDPDNDRLAVRVERADLSTSPVLQLGDIDVYGSFGVIVEIEGGGRYAFAADLAFRDYVHRASLRVLWLDRNWQTLPELDAELAIERKFDGRFTLSGLVAPADARYAVPALYKDASAGVVYADDIAFSSERGACDANAGRGDDDRS